MTWYSGESKTTDSGAVVARLVVEEYRSGNSSTITATVQYRRTNSYGGATYQYGSGCNINITIDGETFVCNQSQGSHGTIPGYNNDWITFASATKTISHTAARSITCSWNTSNMGAYLSCSGSVSCTLAAFITGTYAQMGTTYSTSSDVSAYIYWPYQSGVQIDVICELISDSGVYIRDIHKWTNQSCTTGYWNYYSLSYSERQSLDSSGTNKIRWTIRTIYNGSTLLNDTHDYDYYRASTISTSRSDVGVGQYLTIYANRQRSSLTHKVTISVGSDTIRTISSVGTSCIWDPANDQAALARHATSSSSVSVTVQLSTYYGSTYVGSQSTSVTVQLNLSELAPAFTDFSYKDINPKTTAITGNDSYIIKGQSELQVYVTTAQKMVPKEGATGKSYSFTLGTTTVSAAYSGTSTVAASLGYPPESGTQRITAKAFDSRLVSTTIYKDMPIIDYNEYGPNIDVKRENDFENLTTVKVNGEYSLIKINGVNKNAIISIKMRHKKATESTWTSWETISFTSSEVNGVGRVTSPGILYDLDNNSAWNFEFEIKDKLNTISRTFTLPKGIPIVDIEDDGRVGINCIPDGSEKGLYLKEQDHLFKQTYPVGAIFESTESTSPGTTFGGGWQQIGTRTVGSNTIYTFRRTY